MSKYPKLMSPFTLRHLKLKNRIAKCAQAILRATPDHFVTDEQISPYEAIAAGGAGMIIFGACLFTPSGFGTKMVGFYDDKFLPGLKRVPEAIHKNGSYVIAQLYHGGPGDFTLGSAPMAASAVSGEDLPCDAPILLPTTRAITLEEIEKVKSDFINSSYRAKQAGFDGVEIHAGNGYLLASFLTRIWNHRDDQYGIQSYENRTRLVRELAAGVREKCGDNFVIGVRMNGQEFGSPRAITVEESVEMAKCISAAGVDYINVCCYGYGHVPLPMLYVPDYWPYPEPDDFMEPYANLYKSGLFVPSAAAIKKAVKTPVLVAGRLNEKLGEKILEENKADLILLGRQLWADPAIANKIKDEQFEDIVRCTRCGTCEDPMFSSPRCRVNPSLGREKELAIKPAEVKKKVVVVGAGPAGMEVARVAALRGHKVTILEKKSYLGGKLHLATMIKGTDFEDVPSIIEYLSHQVKKLPIDIHLKTEATAAKLKELAPDVVILAQGGVYQLPDIEGIDSSNVQGVESLSKVAELPMKLFGAKAMSNLSKIALPGIGKKVIILGGQIEGMQGAVFLKKRGKDVVIIEESNETGRGIPPRYRERMYPWFKKKGVEFLKETTVDKITDKGVEVVNKDGSRQTIEGDTVMVLMPQIPNSPLYEEIKDIFPQVIRIGAANGASSGLMVDAIREGRETGVKV